VGLPDEVGRPVERRHEVDRYRRRSILVVAKRWLEQVVPTFRRRVDAGALDRVERALREGRKGADRLDLVAEQLEPKRLRTRGRESVAGPAADRELAALLAALHSFVPREGEALGERVDPGLVPLRDLDRLRPLVGRRHPLGQRCRGRTDEPAPLQHVESARPFAYEVRRWLGPGAPAGPPTPGG